MATYPCGEGTVGSLGENGSTSEGVDSDLGSTAFPCDASAFQGTLVGVERGDVFSCG